MQHLNRSRMMGQHFRQAAVSHRAFI
jgi:hypothetical protein